MVAAHDIAENRRRQREALAKAHAKALVESDLDAWEVEGLLRRIIERRDEPGCCSCEWEVVDVRAYLADAGASIDEDEALAIIEAYPAVLRAALDEEAELLALEDEVDEVLDA